VFLRVSFKAKQLSL